MYAKFSGAKVAGLKPHHHVRVDREFRQDCQMWEIFLIDINAVIRPFIDLSKTVVATELKFFTDASANEKLGFGGIFENNWIFGCSEPSFVKECQPSIEYLE